ncbi:MAG: hypothetical protein DRG50_06150, partial [Deltaproteobacteria bacterium]
SQTKRPRTPPASAGSKAFVAFIFIEKLLLKSSYRSFLDPWFSFCLYNTTSFLSTPFLACQVYQMGSGR